MTKLTPLKIGDILIASPAIRQKAIAALNERGLSWPEGLLRALICEYAHNEAFEKAGMQYWTTEMWATYDRFINDQWQDDKCAMWSRREGVMALADTHTCSTRELHDWERQGTDVIIHSFTQTLPDQDSFTYGGAISFQKLSAKGLFVNSKFKADQVFFSRKYALKTCAPT